MQQTAWLSSVVQARFLVGALGECASPPWWRSEATSPASRRMLERIYPRTFLAASLDTAGWAASLEHDAHIGRIGTYHLSRLPTADEIVIHDLLQQPGGISVLKPLAALQGGEQQLGALFDLAAGAPASAAQGPIHCGTVDELHHSGTLQRLCAAYAAGFRAGRPVYP